MSFRWHRIGVTVKGDSITLVLDCVHQITRKLDRGVDSKISTNGLILSGRQLNEDEDFFVGDVQMLSIADSPDEAYHICTKYAPDCSNGQTNKHSNSNEKYSSGVRSTSSRSSSRITSSRGNNKKKNQSFNSAADIIGHSYVTNQNEKMVQISATSRSSEINHSSLNELGDRYNGRPNIVSSQSNHAESISSPKNLKTVNGSISKFDGASYNDDYFDSIDESFYDEADVARTVANLTNEQTGKSILLISNFGIEFCHFFRFLFRILLGSFNVTL